MNAHPIEFYIKTKKNWDKRSSVRSSDEEYDLKLSDSDLNDDTGLQFSTFCPILNHEKLKFLDNSQRKYVTALQLLEFLIKTTKFEVDHVNRVANSLALGKYKFDIPKVLKLDALKIYTDEGYHAYFSQKISDQIMDYLNVKDDLMPYVVKFFDKVDNIKSKFDEKYDYLSDLSSVIIAESMICQDISEEMKGIVYEPIRIMFREHLHDEYFHANFFKTIFKILWPQLSSEEKEIMGQNLLDAMNVFAEPRTDIYFYSLSKIGFSNEIISKCIDDIYKNDEWKVEKAKKRMSHSLKLLDRCGVFEIQSLKKKFEHRGFI
tara:strand:+ start:3548 stop:4504 length:957 start_codon:yes stop_codon:yes gene_type:complete